YLRAGSDSGLSRGSAVTVVTKDGKKVGTAMVMETWPQLSRVSLDEAAKADKTPNKYVSLTPKDAPPPPPAVAPPPPPPAAADDKPAAPSGPLKGYARYWGAGPWTVLQVFNENEFDWHDCKVTMVPMNATYRMKILRAGDHEAIGKSNFSRTDFSDNPSSVSLGCKEGPATLQMR
ncbi:MAG: hypothetical protein JNK82_38755, partial [Myxococcaceae bacterium]|nr:hypothetical protein [Myxococcaceae bacterium]